MQANNKMPANSLDMLFDFARLSARERYKLLLSTIVPRPIAWITTVDLQGRLNAAPFSFFNAFAPDPPVVGVGIGSHEAGRPKDTRRNIQDTREFVINLVSEEMAALMNITATEFAPGISELRKLIWTRDPRCTSSRCGSPAVRFRWNAR